MLNNESSNEDPVTLQKGNPLATPCTHLLPSLLIGVSAIDKEHDELVAELNTLANHPEALPDNDFFSEVLSKLGGRIVAHFSNEEAFFKSSSMPEQEIARHIQAHTEIIEQYSLLNLALMQGKGFGRTEVLIMIKDWIIGHVVCFDLNIKNYLPKNDSVA
jgi:hemerythrin